MTGSVKLLSPTPAKKYRLVYPVMAVEIMAMCLMTAMEDAAVSGAAVNSMAVVKVVSTTDVMAVEVAEWLLLAS